MVDDAKSAVCIRKVRTEVVTDRIPDAASMGGAHLGGDLNRRSHPKANRVGAWSIRKSRCSLARGAARYLILTGQLQRRSTNAYRL